MGLRLMRECFSIVIADTVIGARDQKAASALGVLKY